MLDVTKKIEKIIDDIIKIEGGYSDHSSDSGGKTRFGITEEVARSFGFRGDMKGLPESVARHIYKTRYITSVGFDMVVSIDPEIGLEIIDTGVNMGSVTAAMFLQRWLNGFNSKNKYSDLFVDGRIGSASISALHGFLDWRGEAGKEALLNGLNCTQGCRYLDITENNKSQRDFLFGWISQRVSRK